MKIRDMKPGVPFRLSEDITHLWVNIFVKCGNEHVYDQNIDSVYAANSNTVLCHQLDIPDVFELPGDLEVKAYYPNAKWALGNGVTARKGVPQ